MKFKEILYNERFSSKANNRPDGISTKMYDTFMENVQGANVTTFDVFAEDMPYFGQDLSMLLVKYKMVES